MERSGLSLWRSLSMICQTANRIRVATLGSARTLLSSAPNPSLGARVVLAAPASRFHSSMTSRATPIDPSSSMTLQATPIDPSSSMTSQATPIDPYSSMTSQDTPTSPRSFFLFRYLHRAGETGIWRRTALIF